MGSGTVLGSGMAAQDEETKDVAEGEDASVVNNLKKEEEDDDEENEEMVMVH